MKIIVSNRSGVPIYEQIKEQIKEAIFSGDLLEDDQLPTIRQLAKDLKISVITTTRAYVIPPKSNNPNPWECDWWLYKERRLVECFFQKLKWFRRVATRYDKRDDSFLTFVYIAAIAFLVK